MAPHSTQVDNNDPEVDPKENKNVKLEIVWSSVMVYIIQHIGAIIGLYLGLFICKWQTVVAFHFFGVISGMGITAGVHRLWCHKTYKAKLPLRIILMCLNSMANQSHIYEWARDHRVHHKYSETNADPYNTSNGIFFAHIGWLMCRKHPDVKTKGKTVDSSDLWEDPVVSFQYKYFIPLVLLFCYAIPTYVPYYFWGEDFWTAFFVCAALRQCVIMHVTFMVNSIAHFVGGRPYDKGLRPTENRFVSFATFGEGYHNYHHAFPYDYSTSELGWDHNFNFSTMFIDFMAKIGWAYDLKKVPKELVQKKMERSGDKTDLSFVNHKGYTPFQWGIVFLVNQWPILAAIVARTLRAAISFVVL